MITVIGFILFFIYTSLIFFVKNISLLVIILAINIMLMLIFKIRAKNVTFFIVKLLPFIIFTSVLNILLGNLERGILCRDKISFSLPYYIYFLGKNDTKED